MTHRMPHRSPMVCLLLAGIAAFATGPALAQSDQTQAPQTVDLGTWCLQAAPFPLPNEDIGKNDYFYATKACVDAGGFLPTAAQLIGAASRVKLSSTIDDAPVSSSPDIPSGVAW